MTVRIKRLRQKAALTKQLRVIYGGWEDLEPTKARITAYNRLPAGLINLERRAVFEAGVRVSRVKSQRSRGEDDFCRA
jgi:hypothetical protein